MEFTDNGTTAVGFATPKYYPADNSALYICGLYPSTGWADPANDECKFTFNGSQDVMVASEQSSTKDASKGKLSCTYVQASARQLVVKAVAENQAAIDAWGNLTDITLTKVGSNDPTSAVTVTLSAGTADESFRFATPLTGGMSFWVKGASPPEAVLRLKPRL